MPGGSLVLAPMRVEEWMLRRGVPRTSIMRIGMGRAKSQAAVERLANASFDRLVIAGVCGSLDPSFRPGDVLVPRAVSAADVEPTTCTVPPDLVRMLHDARLTVHEGTLVSTPKLENNDRAIRTHDGTGAIGVDMESAWLARAAGDRPVVVVRIASDSPTRPLFHPGVLYWGTLSLRRLAQVSRVLGAWLQAPGSA